MSKLLSGRYWLAIGVVSATVGLCLAFFSVAAVGLSVSGSGCGRQCEETVAACTYFAKWFLSLAVFSAVFSVSLIWIQKVPVSGGWRVVITTFNLLMLLVCGVVLFLLAE
ncbi:hypothetical protein [Pseudomonas delhiensis]|uniref:hypothetical protein n=1 Tax=Pseudomonas delhiensis TaxID=366289 RepID=UPI0011139012|nr:hypothetical protein [Pseudomonas delhiensis]